MQPKLGIIAGGGDLPVRIIDACRAAGRPFFVLALEGQTPQETVAGTSHAWVRMGAGGNALSILRNAKVEELVLAGPVRRPTIAELKPDLWTAKFVARAGVNWRGDDGILGALVRELEQKEGFRVVGAESLLPEVLAGEGVYGRVRPDEQALSDIERGIAVALALCALDVGQACVVQQGLVLATEAIEGTDAMLARAGELRREGPGGVLVKVGMPKKEGRADLPTIGLASVRAAAAVGLRGIAIEAGRALVIDRDQTTEAANAAGLFIVGVGVSTDAR